MSQQSKFVYEAQRIDYQAVFELGVFSSDEVAESACKLDYIEQGHIFDDSEWKWQPIGHTRFCEINSITFYIQPREIDMRIPHAPV